jgi:hypothetical protein
VFEAGASVASVVWFTLLGTGAQWLAPILAKPTAWRVLDGIIAAVMAVMGVSLLVVQERCPGHRGAQTVTATLPRALPASRWRMASDA